MRGATVVALICVSLLGGCATPDLGPTPAELKARWEAQNIYPQNYKADLIAFLETLSSEVRTFVTSGYCPCGTTSQPVLDRGRLRGWDRALSRTIRT